MPKDDGLVADVQSRARGTLYNWKRPFNDRSVAYYRAGHREAIELNRACDLLRVPYASARSGSDGRRGVLSLRSNLRRPGAFPRLCQGRS